MQWPKENDKWKIIIHITLHRKLSIAKHESHENMSVTPGVPGR
jgi:hypothetical protein